MFNDHAGDSIYIVDPDEGIQSLSNLPTRLLEPSWPGTSFANVALEWLHISIDYSVLTDTIAALSALDSAAVHAVTDEVRSALAAGREAPTAGRCARSMTPRPPACVTGACARSLPGC